MLLSKSGGLVYHARAWRSAGALWRPFRDAVAGWLAERLPSATELVLVGPSAGHCLPLALLARHPRVLVLEPDPFARFLLRRRLLAQSPRLHFESEARDQLLRPLLEGSSGLEQVLERRPSASVLFCNVLGQLHFGLSDEQQARLEAAFRERIVPQLAARAWASFHDRWSCELSPQQALPGPSYFPRRPSDDELGRYWFGQEGSPVEVLDHGTTQLFPPELPRRYFGWRIKPGAVHIVEALPAASY